MQSSTPSSTSSFHLFHRLPPEIRLCIWSLTISHRIVDVLAFNKRISPSQELKELKDDRVYTSQTSPPILFVCRESRYFALGQYKHSLDTEDQRSPRFHIRREEIPTYIKGQLAGWHLPCRKNSQLIPGEIRPKIHFNLEKDVFCLKGVWWFVGAARYIPSKTTSAARFCTACGTWRCPSRCSAGSCGEM